MFLEPLLSSCGFARFVPLGGGGAVAADEHYCYGWGMRDVQSSIGMNAKTRVFPQESYIVMINVIHFPCQWFLSCG